MPLVLIIDDDEATRDLFTAALEGTGVETATAATGEEALKSPALHQASLIISDLAMPGMHGFEVFKALRDKLETYVPILIVTGESGGGLLEAGLALGADDFLRKPVTISEFRARVGAQLRIKALMDETRELRERLEGFVNTGTKRLIQHDKDDEASMHYRTVLFADLRGFTSLSQRLSPGEVFNLLNDVLEVQAEAVEDEGGDVDKFIGDALLAVFEDASAAVRAARTMMQTSYGILEKAGYLELLPGIGLNSGWVMEGVLGKRHLRTHTVIGDVVNVAARLCGIAHGGALVASESTLQPLDSKDRSAFKDIRQVKVRGRDLPITVGFHLLHGEHPMKDESASQRHDFLVSFASASRRSLAAQEARARSSLDALLAAAYDAASAWSNPLPDARASKLRRPHGLPRTRARPGYPPTKSHVCRLAGASAPDKARRLHADRCCARRSPSPARHSLCAQSPNSPPLAIRCARLLTNPGEHTPAMMHHYRSNADASDLQAAGAAIQRGRMD